MVITGHLGLRRLSFAALAVPTASTGSWLKEKALKTAKRPRVNFLGEDCEEK
jgi:hypothetical protein